jgi:hypothetical protein
MPKVWSRFLSHSALFSPSRLGCASFHCVRLTMIFGYHRTLIVQWGMDIDKAFIRNTTGEDSLKLLLIGLCANGAEKA